MDTKSLKLIGNIAFSAILTAFATTGAQSASVEDLPALKANLSQTSVSGLSSGAFMTSQFYIANSEIMVGAGIVAGGPYLCSHSWAGNSMMINAMNACMNPLTAAVGPNLPVLLEESKQYDEAGVIDHLSNLSDDHVYIFSGQSDETVTTVVVDKTEAYYEAVGVKKENIKYNKSVDAGHAMITDNNSDTKCDLTESPYINDCDFEQSHRILNHIYPDLKPAITDSSKLSGEIIAFNQQAFIESPNTSMSNTGYLYVPKACESESCRVHVVFHGCKQGAEVIGDKYYAQTGYNEIADANNFIVLYPQVTPSSTAPLNPEGCWDFWGYSSPKDPAPDFYSKNAPQISAVRRMVDQLGKS